MARVPVRRGGSSLIDQYGLRPDRGVIALLVVYLVSWAFLRFGGPEVGAFFVRHIALTPRLAIGPEPWQLITSGFIVARLSSVLYLAVTLIFFGNALERDLGAGGLWKIYLAGIFGGSVLVGLVGRVVAPEEVMFVGEAAGTAILVAYAVQLGRQQMAFGSMPVSAGSIAWIWVGISVIRVLLDSAEEHDWLRGFLELTQMLGGGLAGWLVVTRGAIGSGGVRDSMDRFKMWRLRRRYKVISGGRGRGDDKSYLN